MNKTDKTPSISIMSQPQKIAATLGLPRFRPLLLRVLNEDVGEVWCSLLIGLEIFCLHWGVTKLAQSLKLADKLLSYFGEGPRSIQVTSPVSPSISEA